MNFLVDLIIFFIAEYTIQKYVDVYMYWIKK